MKRKTPLCIGLTGSIGMGKSATARMFGLLGARLFDADKVVRGLLMPDGAAFVKVAKQFPEARRGNRLCRKRLGDSVHSDPARRKKLEDILHPLVWKAKRAFLAQAKKDKISVVLFEIPLLFETGEHKNMDIVICVTAKKSTQRDRVLKRKNMTKEKLRAILTRQLPDVEKRKRADFVIDTDEGFAASRQQVKRIWKEITHA